MNPLLDRTRPLVIAHRGGAALAPENTIEAFDNGLSLGADGLELDVRLARDGRLVVIHDATLGRTTGARGDVGALTLDEIQRLDAGARFVDIHGQNWADRGARIPTLDAVLRRYPDTPIIIELKGDEVAIAAAAVACVREADAVERVCFGGFRRPVLQAVRRLDPRVATSAARIEGRVALYQSWIGWPIRTDRYRVFQVPEHSREHRVVSPRFIGAAHRAGLPVQVWTVNREADMRRLLTWGVDALITDRPDLGVPLVREWNCQSAILID